MEEALVHRKRSSRIAIKESEKEEAELAAKKKQEEDEKMSRARRLEARQLKEAAEREKKESAREQRRRERELREQQPRSERHRQARYFAALSPVSTSLTTSVALICRLMLWVTIFKGGLVPMGYLPADLVQ